MKKFFVPVVAVLLFGTISANAQSVSQPAKPQPKSATTTAAAAQKSMAPQAKPATAATAKTNSLPATKPATNSVASSTKPAAGTTKPKKTHRLHKMAKSQTNAQPTGTTGGTAQKSKAGKQ